LIDGCVNPFARLGDATDHRRLDQLVDSVINQTRR